MTGPSAIGSLKGTPSSMIEAPEWANSTISFPVVTRFGSPAVMKGMNPFFPDWRRALNVSVMRVTDYAIPGRNVLITKSDLDFPYIIYHFSYAISDICVASTVESPGARVGYAGQWLRLIQEERLDHEIRA